MNEYFKKNGFLPPDKKLLYEWKLETLYAPLVSSIESGRSYPNLPKWGNIEATLVEMFSAIWSLVDVKGFYTDKELYLILTRYDDELNRMLGRKANENKMSYPKFLSSFD